MNKTLLYFIFIIVAKAGAQTSALAEADSLYAVGNYSEAIEKLEQIEPQSPKVLGRLAKAQKAYGDPAAAMEAYQTVLQEDPDQVLSAVEYAKLLSAAGKLKAADSIFKNLIKKYPNNPDFYYQLGLVREKQKDSSAMSLFNVTLYIQKTHQPALIKVSKKALVEGHLAKAERLAKQGLEVNPNQVTLLSILAQAYYYGKDYENAVVEFEKLVALGQGSEFIHSKLGTAYFQLSKLEKAIENFNKALDYNEKNYASHYSLGKLYALNGEYENSEGHLLQSILLKAVTLDEEYTSLGLTYKSMKKPKQALTYFNKAIEENPINERAMLERALAADSYYKDLRTRLNYYQEYLDKFSELGSPNFMLLAMRRVKDIREEMHMKGMLREAQ
ncbi:Tetratricopeptide repeat-containing protein [Salinimicrobium catena]|uniref:Tetratricopeptide repeat-containing protein n=1 Tax=Salinimicrobium catena TaxID=390640 RepID=A0A1H5JQA1_9FLAO|nr:tetratricopeptide repeat protein [Salinimicrobium catena]SDK89417.1 Tetratricopeptide repeat-containing protein [Salinimicrobium catena]SEE54763.1 Tetratricopeptide repeat-containing protein [Salinimicrobium catena]